jgi:KDO2-lipid IV(A) lauroyltransferase
MVREPPPGEYHVRTCHGIGPAAARLDCPPGRWYKFLDASVRRPGRVIERHRAAGSAHPPSAFPSPVTLRSLLRALRFDGLWWRKFAYLGSVHGPEWWKRYSPPWIAAIIFLCVRRNRRGAIANMRRVLGTRGWLRDHWHGLKVFIGFAHCMNEEIECLSPYPKPITVERPDDDPIEKAVAEGRGAVLVTCHFGNWDVAARTLARYGRPFNLVMAREVNETTAEYVRSAREAAGMHILLSDSSVYGPFNMLRALRRGEIVALQLDRPIGGDGARPVDFFGAPALFQSGALRLARLAGTPIFPVFVARRGPRHYRIVVGTERRVARTAGADDVDRMLAGIVGEFEDLVREYPDQWFQFAPFWPEDGALCGSVATAPRRAGGDAAPTIARAR